MANFSYATTKFSVHIEAMACKVVPNTAHWCIYIIKSGVRVCVFVNTRNVQMLTSPPILKLCDTQGYLWLPYDLTEAIKLIGVTFKQFFLFFFETMLYVIPSALLSFLPYYCHSLGIIVIPSVLVSFLPNIVIPSKLLPFQIFVILNSSCTLPYPKGEKIGRQSGPYLRVFTKLCR